MADRTLVSIKDKYVSDSGWQSVLRIERSSAGQPTLLFSIENYLDGVEQNSSLVVVEDGNALLEDVLNWLDDE